MSSDEFKEDDRLIYSCYKMCIEFHSLVFSSAIWVLSINQSSKLLLLILSCTPKIDQSINSINDMSSLLKLESLYLRLRLEKKRYKSCRCQYKLHCIFSPIFAHRPSYACSSLAGPSLSLQTQWVVAGWWSVMIRKKAESIW